MCRNFWFLVKIKDVYFNELSITFYIIFKIIIIIIIKKIISPSLLEPSPGSRKI